MNVNLNLGNFISNVATNVASLETTVKDNFSEVINSTDTKTKEENKVENKTENKKTEDNVDEKQVENDENQVENQIKDSTEYDNSEEKNTQIETDDRDLLIYNIFANVFLKTNPDEEFISFEEFKERFIKLEFSEDNEKVSNDLKLINEIVNLMEIEDLQLKLPKVNEINNEDFTLNLEQEINDTVIDEILKIFTDENEEIDINKSIDSMVKNLKEYINNENISYEDENIYKKLDNFNPVNVLKLSETNISDKDMKCLEDIVNDNKSNTFLFTGINNTNTQSNDIQFDIEAPIQEIREEFLAEDIVKGAKYINAKGIEELNVKLNPQELGEISIKISKSGEVANLVITVEKDSVFEMINKNATDIKNQLNTLKIDEVVVVNKSEGKELFEQSFSDDLNKNFNQQQNSSKRKVFTQQEEEIEEVNFNNDSLNILI
jgi:hypothetical protein